MKYIKKFKEHSEYEEYISGGSAVLSNVSFCADVRDLHYNPYEEDESYKYLVVKYLTTEPNENVLLFNWDGDEQWHEEEERMICRNLFYDVEIDGAHETTDVDLSEGHFELQTPGTHTVVYQLKDPTSIHFMLFLNCAGITSVTIPNSVSEVGYQAFNGCPDLKEVRIGNGVTNIGTDAFSECPELEFIHARPMTAPRVYASTFENVGPDGTLYVPVGGSGYDQWMSDENYYLGKYGWEMVTD